MNLVPENYLVSTARQDGSLHHIPAVTWRPGDCADGRLLSDNCRRHLSLSGEQDGGRERTAEEILRLQENQREDLVCPDPPFNTWPGGLAVWADPLDGGSTPNPANPGCSDCRHVACAVPCGAGGGVGLV